VQVEEAVESEPDLDQRVRMLEEVVNENPEVPEFNRLLQGTQEKRDLVNSIVSRARELETRELYGEALVQWETLQTIYPIFPGLNFEIENVRLRRQLSERMARKNHWITEIHQALESGDFEECHRLLSPAVEEFPEDEEFVDIRADVRRYQELAEQAEKLIREGRRRLEEGEIASGLEKLRSAYETGSKVKRAKPELVEGLLRAARASQSDPPQARSYLQEILTLDPGNHAAAGLLRFLDDQTEYQKVDEILSQARQLRSSNDLSGAITLLEHACHEYPRNPRLRQMSREMDASRTEQRTRDLEVVRRKRLEANTLVIGPSLNEQLALVEQIASRYGNDEEFQNESRMLRARLHTIAGIIGEAGESQPHPQITGNGKPPAMVQGTAQKNRTQNKQLYAVIGGATAVLFLVIVILLWRRTSAHPHRTAGIAAASALTEYKIHAVPSGAHILHDGQEVGVASPDLDIKLPAGKTSFQAQLYGYEPQTETMDAPADHPAEVNFALRPASQQLRVVGNGSLSVNGEPATPLSMGMFTGELSAGNDTLHWIGRGGYDATFHVDVQDGKPANLVGPAHAGSNGAALLVSVASQQAKIYTTTAMPLVVDGAAHGEADFDGVDIDLPRGVHTIVAGKQPHLLTGKVESGGGRLLLIAFENAPSLGSLTVLTNTDGVSIKLLRGTAVVQQGTSVDGRLDIASVPAGKYTLQAFAPFSETIAPQPVVINKDENATVKLQIQKVPVVVPVKVRTLPGANILLDGKAAGSTGLDGTLLLSSTVGSHHIEARREGTTSTLDINLNVGQAGPYIADLKLDKGKGTVTLELDPANSAVTVYNTKGEQVPVVGAYFDLPEGKYHFIARANGYTDRGEAADVTANGATTVDLKLSPLAASTASPTIEGWDPQDWTVDAKNHTLVHQSQGVGLYAAQPARGKFIFSASIGRGFLFDKPRIEWVANYHDPGHYLLFTLDHSGLELFNVSGGKKTAFGNKIDLPDVSKYQILLQIMPGHITTFISDGHKWKQLSDWTGLPENVDAGKFGFKGSITLTSFSYMR
jgi:serine/threonine-protein kinase